MASSDKIAAIGVTCLGLLIAYELVAMSDEYYKPFPKRLAYNFFTLLAFFAIIAQRGFPKISLDFGQNALRKVDQTWLEKLGPKGLAFINLLATKLTGNTPQGLIKAYLGLFLITLIIGIGLAALTTL